jgi:DNA modification methylase
LIFDPFLGTGTTIDAAIQLHRFGAGCEIDLDCCKAITTRLWNTSETLIQHSILYHNINRTR